MKRKNKLIINMLLASLSIGLINDKEVSLSAGANNMTAPKQSYLSDTSNVENYYNNISGLKGLSGNNLLNKLASSMDSKHRYYTTYNDIRGANAYSDEDPDNKSNLICFYSGESISNTWDGGETWNREHVWCQSLSNGLYGTEKGAGTDIHQLKPTKKGLNSSRNNRAYAELKGKYAKAERQLDKSTNKYTDNYLLDGINTYNENGLFEPKDDIKGDIARTLMYVYTHYSTDIASNKTLMDHKGNSISGDLDVKTIVYTPDGTDSSSIALLLKWSLLDPVSDFERNRNAYCASITGVRNPYIDHPEFLKMIWDDSYSGTGALLDTNVGDSNTFTLNSYEETIGINSSFTISVIDSKNTPTYTSLDSTIATVSSNGLVTPVKVGTTQIQVKIGNETQVVTIKVVSNTTYTVNLYINDKSNTLYKSINVPKDEAIGDVEDPSRDGYLFNGWALDSSGTNMFTITTPITANLDLYATWSKTNLSTLVTSSSDIKVGCSYLIASATSNKIMAKEGNNSYSNRKAMTATKDEENNTISYENGTYHAEIVTLRAGSTSGTYLLEVDNDKGKYLEIPGDSNAIKTTQTATSTNEVKITVNTDKSVKIASNVNSYSIFYNQGSDLFSSYSTSTQKPICLYKINVDTSIDVNYTSSISFNGVYANDSVVSTNSYTINVRGNFKLSDSFNGNQQDISNLQVYLNYDNKDYEVSNVTLTDGVVNMYYEIAVSDLKKQYSYSFNIVLKDTTKKYESEGITISYMQIVDKFVSNPDLLNGVTNKDKLYNSLLFIKNNN